jgi:hypothetical protein
MTVISDCFEQEVESPATYGLLRLGGVAHLERAVERLGQDLRP